MQLGFKYRFLIFLTFLPIRLCMFCLCCFVVVVLLLCCCCFRCDIVGYVAYILCASFPLLKTDNVFCYLHLVRVQHIQVVECILILRPKNFIKSNNISQISVSSLAATFNQNNFVQVRARVCVRARACVCVCQQALSILLLFNSKK